MKTALILLMLTYVTPPDQPDIRRQMKQSSLEECWDNARAFVEQGVPAQFKERGALAVMAGCLVQEPLEEHL